MLDEYERRPVESGYQKAVVQPEADMCKMRCSPAVLQLIR